MRIDFGSLDSSVPGTRGRRTVDQAVTVPSLGTFFTEFRKVEEDVSIPLICSEVLTNERMLHVGESTKRGAWDGLFLKPQPRRIPRGRKISLYMYKLSNALSVVSSQDYTLEMRHRGKE